MAEAPSLRDFYKSSFPEQFSDSTGRPDAKLNRETLALILETLTSDNKEHEFETFCREMFRREICPNIIEQTGPTGGGDSKVDSETYPVDVGLARNWPYVEAVTAANERWALTISAKKDWSSKVKSDVLKVKEVDDSTSRGYRRVYFLSSQLISDKRRGSKEDELRGLTGYDVRILDRNWLIRSALSTRESRLATVQALNITEDFVKDDLEGGRDHQRRLRLEEIELHLASDESLSRITRVQLAAEAAELTCQLERGDGEIVGALERCLRLAKRTKDRIQIAQATYWYAYHLAGWCVNPDFELFYERYRELEHIAADDRTKLAIGNLITLWMVLNSLAYGRESEVDLESHAKTIEGIICDVSSESDRYVTSLELSMRFLSIRLMRGENGEVILSEALRLLKESEGILGIDYSHLALLLRQQYCFDEFDSYDEVLKLLYKRINQDEGSSYIAPVLVERGRKLAAGGRHYEAIRYFSNAMSCSRTSSERDVFLDAAQGLAASCSHAGLRWAARNAWRLAMNVGIDLYYSEAVLSRAIAISCEALVESELTCGNIANALKLDAFGQLILSLYDDLDLGADFVRWVNSVLSLAILALSEDELRLADGFPEFLAQRGYGLPSLVAKYALGYPLELLEDIKKDGTKDPERTIVDFYCANAGSPSFPAQCSLGLFDGLDLVSNLLGTRVAASTSLRWECYETACTIMGAIEGFFATGSLYSLISVSDRLTFKVVYVEPQETPFRLSRSGEQVVVNVSDLGRFEPDTLRDAVRELITNMIAIAVEKLFPYKEARSKIERMADDDFAFNRAYVFSDSLTIGADNIDRLALGYCPADGEYPYIRERSFREEHPIDRTKSEQWYGPAGVAFRPSKGDISSKTIPQQNISHQSVINASLWDRATWRGMAYAVGPDGTPCICLVYKNESGLLIFDEWLEHGDADIRRLGLSIIKNIDAKNPNSYRVVIGTRIVAPPRVLDGEQIIIMTSRFLNLTPKSLEPLCSFESALMKSEFVHLYPSCGMPGNGPLSPRGKRITLPRESVRIVNAGELTRDDLFECSALLPDDCPLIRQGDSDEVINIINERRDQE